MAWYHDAIIIRASKQKGEMFNGIVRLGNISCHGHKRITTGKNHVLHARSTEFEFGAMYKPTPLSVSVLLAQFISLD
jgi:hypothetical protein